MKVLYVTCEAVPFVKVGGLGDVMGALPKKLADKGIDARVIMPLYSAINDEMRAQMKYVGSVMVPVAWRSSYCGVFKLEQSGITFYFLDNEQYFKRTKIYGDYDEAEVSAFFSKAVLEAMPVMEFMPDVIHVNDWQTALTPVYLNMFYRTLPEYRNIKTVLSIHNIEFQGKYDPFIMGSIFGIEAYHRPLFMYDGCLNILKAGIESVDRIVTVSPSYSKEIQYPTHSHGLHSILNARHSKITGILNGIDTELFDPAKDSALAVNYDYKKIMLKSRCKKALQKSMGLEQRNDVPLIGMVSRLTPQKGFDLIQQVKQEIEDMDIQLIVVGTGDKDYEDFLSEWERSCHTKIRSFIDFSSQMASQVYAGADMFLMPSISEPCGLSQMIAMRYGTVPIVRAVGGLADTVQAYNPETNEGTGITFQSDNAYDMLDAVRRAIELYYDKKNWKQIRKNDMSKDFGWDKPAEEYIELYNSLM